jgi:hypothetical protein
VRQTLEPLLPPGSWSLEAAVEPARWIIYMGKYLTPDAVNKKKAELRQIGVSFEGCPMPRWSLACRWAALPARRRPSSSWTGWPSAACAPPAWHRSGLKRVARCCACRRWTMRCAPGWKRSAGAQRQAAAQPAAESGRSSP